MNPKGSCLDRFLPVFDDDNRLGGYSLERIFCFRGNYKCVESGKREWKTAVF